MFAHELPSQEIDDLFSHLKQLEQQTKNLEENQPLSQALNQLKEEIFPPLQEQQRLCDEAIDQLSDAYVEYLDMMDSTEDPLTMIQALYASEEIWKKSVATITKFDTEGSEKNFLLEMREHATTFFEKIIIREADKNIYQPNQDRQIFLSMMLTQLNTMYHELEALNIFVSPEIKNRLIKLSIQLL